MANQEQQTQPQQPQPQQPAQAMTSQAQTKQSAAGNSNSQQQTGPAQQPNPNTTQNTLQISELRDNMVILKDGSFRAVIACQSINFDLMSDREREGIEFSYQNFLNSLYFPVQILVRSRRVELGNYLDKLARTRRDQDNMLLGMLMDDYMDFIDRLSQEANIMDKQFYIVVPYYQTGDLNAGISNSKNIFTGIFATNKSQHIKINKDSYIKAKDEIKNRVNSVTSSLFQMGIKSGQLNTKQLANLYYNVYNPDTSVNQPLSDYETITGTFTQKGINSTRGDK